jgi:hypothetical protein
LKQEQKKWKEYHHCVSKLKTNFPHLNLTQAWQPLLMVFFLMETRTEECHAKSGSTKSFTADFALESATNKAPGLRD